MQNIENIPKFYLTQALNEYEKGKYAHALQRFNIALGSLEGNEDQTILLLAYDIFDKIIDKVDTIENIRNSMQCLLSASADPYFSQEQQRLSYKTAQWFFKNGLFTNALFCVGQALRIESRNKLDKKAAKIFRISSIHLSTFQSRLKAFGISNEPEMRRLKEDIPKRFEHFPWRDKQAFIRLFYDQIGAFFANTFINNQDQKRLKKVLPTDLDYQMALEGNTKIGDRYLINRYKRKIKEFRCFFQERLNVADVRALQAEVSAEFHSFIKDLIKDAFAILGDPPCGYDMRAMGSLAREEICPYSDLEWCILVEKEEEIPYFTQLACLLEWQARCLGETPSDGNPAVTCLGKQSGFHIDQSGNPAEKLTLIAIPKVLAKQQTSLDDRQPPRLANSLRKTVSLNGTTDALYTEYIKHARSGWDENRKFYTQLLITDRIECFEKNWETEIGTHISLKGHYSELLFHLLNDFSFYFEIDQANTLDIIEELIAKKVFTEQSGILLKEAVSVIYLSRCKTELKEQGQQGLFPFHKKNPRQQSLEKVYWLVLRPIYCVLRQCFSKNDPKNSEESSKCLASNFSRFDFHFKDFDLIEWAFSLEDFSPNSIDDFLPLIKHLSHHLVHHHFPYRVHEDCYKRLPKLSFAEPLRKAYIDELKLSSETEIFKHLIQISSRCGYRQSHRLEEDYLQKAIQGLTNSSPGVFKVKIRCPALPNGAYLKDEIVHQIFDENGLFQRQYSSMHAVAKASYVDDQGHQITLHFKQKPSNPLMEYGIHSFSGRIGGHLTPASQLARFDIEEDSYPVLISLTVHGPTLQEMEDKGPIEGLDPVQFTWACLAAILTRPGDGRLTNYIVQEGTGRIFCVDNDISFVEPVTANVFSNTYHFTSALFCIDPKPLDLSVLEAFLDLSPNFILQDWIEELIEKNAAYSHLCLFSKEEEERFYNENKEDRFKGTFLLRKGTMATLLVQFFHLQDAIRRALSEKRSLYPLDLLKSLVTLRDTRIQPLHNYAKAFTRSPSVENRLARAVERDVGVSLTTTQSDEPTYGKPLTFEAFQNKEKFSPEKAREELYSFFLKQCASDISFYMSQGKWFIHADFGFILKNGTPDTERQSLVLKAFIFWLESKEIKASAVTLVNCAVLDLAGLKPFLHDKLETLNLSGCALISDPMILEIEKECRRLKHLYLNNCPLLKEFEKSKFLDYPDYFSFPELEELQLSYCSQLVSVSLDVPCMRELEMSNNRFLKRAFFKQAGIIFGFDLYKKDYFTDCPNLNLKNAKLAGIAKIDADLQQWYPKLNQKIKNKLDPKKKQLLNKGFSLFKKAEEIYLEWIESEKQRGIEKKAKIQSLPKYVELGQPDLKIVLSSDLLPFEIEVHRFMLIEKSKLIRDLLQNDDDKDTLTFPQTLLKLFASDKENPQGISIQGLVSLLEYFYSGVKSTLPANDIMETARTASYFRSQMGIVTSSNLLEVLKSNYQDCVLDYVFQLTKHPFETGKINKEILEWMHENLQERPEKIRVRSLLGLCYLNSSLPSQQVEGLKLLERAATEDDIEAIWKLFQYFKEKDRKKGAFWLSQLH